LGNSLEKVGKLEESLAAYKTAVELKPDFAAALNNLGGALNHRGLHREALACYSRSMAADSAMMSAHSNYLYSMHFDPEFSAATIYEAHRAWEQLHAAPLKVFQQPHGNLRQPDRKLRIGYVSADFRDHPVGRFFFPLLALHDPAHFEIFCYSNDSGSDHLTRQLQHHAKVWREIGRMSDERAARLIRDDQIDILVDLAGHTAGNRLAVFAYKPAPVQVTWLGYPDTTGLSSIDYRLTDIHADPPGLTEKFHTEQLVRLPETFLCYRPDDENFPIGPAPALARSYVTFGSFNTLAKINRALVERWAQILRQVPGSHFLFKTKYLGDPSARQHLLDLFDGCDIPADRLEFRSGTPSHVEHLQQYADVDIALDTFPYHGTTTTCEALWMGVPVVTLVGDRHQCRVGQSLLSNVGLPELAGSTPEEYVRIAVDLARSIPRLSQLRSGLRERMRNSPLMDAAGFARNVEAAYRQMWLSWC
jgi:predicted O-linked N-acetylglucosamine transferase (SPINDLY family)